MNVLNLEVGKTYKDYPELCHALGEKVTSSTSKTAQLKNWSYYFKWERVGRAYKILDIYTFALPPDVKRRKKSKFSEAAIPIIINLLYHTDTKDPLYFAENKSNLLSILGFVNNLYPKIDWEHDDNAPIEPIFKELQKEWRAIINQDFDRTLNNLIRNSIFKIEFRYFISYKNDESKPPQYKISTVNQTEIINASSRYIVSEMGFRNLGTICELGLYSVYKQKINTSLEKYQDFVYHGKAYVFSLPDKSKSIAELYDEQFHDMTEQQISDLIHEKQKEINEYILKKIYEKHRKEVLKFEKYHVSGNSQKRELYKYLRFIYCDRLSPEEYTKVYKEEREECIEKFIRLKK